jgi:hypothetical protein
LKHSQKIKNVFVKILKNVGLSNMFLSDKVKAKVLPRTGHEGPEGE